MLFDFASQPFHTLLVTFIFAPYFTSAVMTDSVEGQSIWGFTTAATGLVIALLAPILGALSVAIGAAPASLLAPAAVAASCAFMLPVATAPNAIIYATDEIPIGKMISRGLRVNLIGIVVITAIGFWLAPLVL